MTDLSSTLDGMLQKHNARLAQHRRSIADITDEFLKDAYQIQSHISSLHSYLLSIRAPYLSTSQGPPKSKRTSLHQSSSQSPVYLTPAQRDSIDAESKATLRDLSGAIGRLDATEAQRREIARQLALQRRAKRFPLGALGRWAAGDDALRQEKEDEASMTDEEKDKLGRDKTRDACRDAVLWFLKKRLEYAVELQREMMEIRIQREVERSKSVLYMSKGAGVGAGAGGVEGGALSSPAAGLEELVAQSGKAAALSGDNRGGTRAGSGSVAEDYGLTPEQLQLFAEENSAMLKHYEDSLDQVRAAERSMIEISELQTTLAQNLAMQAERIDVLVDDSQRTEENVTGGNQQLKQAAQRWRPARTFFWVTCGLSGFLVLWDLVI